MFGKVTDKRTVNIVQGGVKKRHTEAIIFEVNLDKKICKVKV